MPWIDSKDIHSGSDPMTEAMLGIVIGVVLITGAIFLIPFPIADYSTQYMFADPETTSVWGCSSSEFAFRLQVVLTSLFLVIALCFESVRGLYLMALKLLVAAAITVAILALFFGLLAGLVWCAVHYL